MPEQPDAAPPLKTAIITGASSGIGLALTNHLLSLSSTTLPSQPLWRVVLADVNSPPSSLLERYHERAYYHSTDVSSWQDNASLFRFANTISSGRIDFFAANAGIDDRESVYIDDEAEEGGPKEPNVKTLDVNLKSVFYGLKCFLHYARRTQRRLRSEERDEYFYPNMVVTASCVALYRFPANPKYCAAKAGIVGLVRSVGESLFQQDKVTVNAILPAFVATGLAPKGLVDAWPREHLTPMETVIRAYDELTDVPKDIGKERKRGECVECCQEDLHWRQQVEYGCSSLEWNVEDKGGFWSGGFSGKTEKRKRDDAEEDGLVGNGEGKQKMLATDEMVNG